MNCTWNEAQPVELEDTVKRLHLRIFEDPQGVEKPIYIFEYTAADSWTTEEKAHAVSMISGALGHGEQEDVRIWEMEPDGRTEEVTFQPFTYTVRSDQGDMLYHDEEFRAAQRAGEAPPDRQYTSLQVQATPVSEEQQRQELGQVLLSYEQTVELAFAGLRGPSVERTQEHGQPQNGYAFQ